MTDAFFTSCLLQYRLLPLQTKAARVPVTFLIIYLITLFYLSIKIREQLYFELSLVTLGVVKFYSNNAKNACTGRAKTCV